MFHRIITPLALITCLGFPGCDDGKKGTEDTATDTLSDVSDVLDDTATDPVEDPVEDSVEDSLEDPAEDIMEDGLVDVSEEDAGLDVVEEDDVDEEVADPDPDLAFVFTVAGDYSTGSYSVVDLADLTVVEDVDTMGTDGKALCLEGQVFMNELFGVDTVDPIQTASPFAVLERHSTGEYSNPVDGILSDATHMLVVLYGGSGLVELDLTDGTTGDTVDLSSFDEADDVPEVHAIAHVGSRYYVSLQRLDTWTAVDAGLVVLLDDTTLEVLDADPSTSSTVDAIELPGNNPIGRFRVLGDHLYVALTGTWGSTDGGIAVIDTTTDTASWAVQGSTLGGDPLFGDCFEIVDASTGYACYGLEDGSADAVKAFDPSASTAADTDVLSTSAGSLSGSALVPDGRMLVGDRDATSPGLRIIDTASGAEITTSPIEVGAHPPYSLCVLSAE